VALGTNTHDNADVTGGVAGFALPDISFTFQGAGINNAASTEAGFDQTSVTSEERRGAKASTSPRWPPTRTTSAPPEQMSRARWTRSRSRSPGRGTRADTT